MGPLFLQTTVWQNMEENATLSYGRDKSVQPHRCREEKALPIFVLGYPVSTHETTGH